MLDIHAGDAAVIVSIPHAGLDIPDDVTGLLSLAVARRDADFHVHQLYDFAKQLGATIVRSRISRTVIDVNRDPSGQSLYPGQTTTGLCPQTTFDGVSLYRDGAVPEHAEVARRRSRYFDPYHAALSGQIDRLRAHHPAVVLLDAHSIRSHVPQLFVGELPLFNIGTFDGASCDPALTDAVVACCADESHVLNGRFKGGWITRHYGQPSLGVHALQMELAMRCYLDESGAWPPAWDAARAAGVQKKLHAVVNACINFAKDRS